MAKKLKNQLLTPSKLSVVIILLTATFLWVEAVPAKVEAQTSFLHSLSNFSGPIPLNWANLSFDQERNEIYITDSRSGEIRIFNDQGMEIYRFGDDLGLGTVQATVARKDGSILVLSKQMNGFSIFICNYRGEMMSELALKAFPLDFDGFSPTDMVYRHPKLYLLDNKSLRLAVTDPNGTFLAGYDLGAITEIEEKKRRQSEIGGFSVDREGNMLFTVPVLFLAFKLAPDGTLTGFGRPGSAPGRFNVIGGIVADDEGYYYVADRLKCVVLIFDKNFNFVKEFGYRGRKSHNLIGPKDLLLDAEGKLYVSQLSSRGVSVFKITFK